MLLNHFIEKLTGLQDIITKNVENFENKTILHVEMPRKEHICPCCGKKTSKIHDYRTQLIKDIPSYGKLFEIQLRKRRYRCDCGKRFIEKVAFLPRYHRMTNRLSAHVIKLLRNERSYTSVAREVNLSVTTIIRIFDIVGYSPSKLSKVLAIDEFKGNTGGEKYNCIITDPENGIVLDILPCRTKRKLIDYFKNKNRTDVKYFVSDMWNTYADISADYFKQATFIVDKYHWIRQAIWAFENVRKQEQKKFSKTHRRYFKRSKSLLTKRFKDLKDEEKQQVNVMLYASATLSSAYFLKEDFMKILDIKDRDEAKAKLSDWILNAQDSEISQFDECAKTMFNWRTGILNSIEHPYTNGFTEGCNNKIKVLKRNAYGYRNFKRFRNRILHIFSHQRDNALIKKDAQYRIHKETAA